MISGIGIDIVETDRMKTAVEQWGDRFLRRIFTEQEIVYCSGHKNPYPHFAARFAAKEALVKAFHLPIPFTTVEICHHPGGEPFVHFIKGLPQCEEVSIHVTLTHERQYAAAMVILESTET